MAPSPNSAGGETPPAGPPPDVGGGVGEGFVPPPAETEEAVPPLSGGDGVEIAALRHRLQTVMQKYVGIVRTDARLQKAADAVSVLQAEFAPLFREHDLTDAVLELRNMLQVGALIIECARQRRESRGLNYNTDYPEPREGERHDTVVRKTCDSAA